MPGGQRPGHRATPVVTDDVETIRSGLVGQRHDVGGEPLEAVGPPTAGPSTRRVAPLVRGQDSVPLAGQQRRQVVPRAARLGKAVQSDHQIALPRP
jgi:hypothetical protein